MVVRSEVAAPATTERPANASVAVYTEGIRAGLAGGAAIAAWFFVLDWLAGHPFYTPTVLGAALFRGAAAAGPGLAPSVELVLAFTWVHFLVFVLLGIAASRLVWLAEERPGLGFGVLLFFVLFEVGFILACLAFAAPVLHALAWPAVLVGNLLAAVTMGWVLWRSHPGLVIEP